MYIISMRALSPAHAHDTTESTKCIGRLNSHLLSHVRARALSVSHTCTQHYWKNICTGRLNLHLLSLVRASTLSV